MSKWGPMTGRIRAAATVLMLALVVLGAAAAPASGATTVVLDEQFDTFDTSLWETTFLWYGPTGWQATSGSSGVSAGAFFMRPGHYRGDSTLHTPDVVITQLPARVTYRVRYPGYTYRDTGLWFVGQDFELPSGGSGPRARVETHFGNTHHAFSDPPFVSILSPTDHWLTLASTRPVVPTDTWLEGSVELLADRVTSTFDGITIETTGDVAAVIALAGGFRPGFHTGDDYGQNGFDVDYMRIEQGSDGPTGDPDNVAPTAVAGPDRTALVGRPAAFDGGASFDPDGSIGAYEWDFGDGSSVATGVATHAYAAAGAYTARLTVTDDDGATGVDEALVRVITVYTSIQELKGDVVRSLPHPPYPRGWSQSLLAKLNSALRSYQKGDYLRAVQMMRAFSNEVRAGRGKRYPAEAADRWLASSAEIQASLWAMRVRKLRR